MERKIKFRGKSIDNRTFIYGDLVKYENGDAAIFEERMTEYGCEATQICRRTKVNPDTIGQFTGLKDKNGRDIYEGDILMCIGKRENNKGRKYYRKVIFRNGSFCMIDPDHIFENSLYNHVINDVFNWEVVGNIYDNPELIKED